MIRYLAAVLIVLPQLLQGGGLSLGTWRYSESSAEAAAAGEVVKIPHSWNAKDVQAGKGTNKMSTDGYRRAPAWYETTLGAEVLPPGKRVFVRFEGVSSVATVSFNGQVLGEHRGPATAFAYELSQMKRDGTDTLAVKADNTWREDVAPISGDFGVFGGIYRPVTLLVKDRVCFSPLRLGDFGAQVRQIRADPDAGELSIRAHLDNAGASADSEVSFHLKDAAGKVVATQSVKKAAAAGASEVEATLAIAKPTLWNGLKNPYLYTLEIELKAADGSADRIALPVGFRTCQIDPQRGFILNGQSYPLRGVNRHQDRVDQGWAITREQEREDAAMIVEIGANTVRCAHYPHSQDFLNECDRLGLLVWSEVSVIDTVGQNPDAFGTNAEIQLREMIHQYSHHPSIYGWSLFNEVGMREGKDPIAVLNRLNDIAHAEDRTRPTVAATNQKNAAFNNIADAMAYNNYPGWYGGGTGSQESSLATFKKTAPNKAWGISEYGAGASLSQQEDGITKGPDPKGKWHPEAWQARVHESALESINRHPELWCTYVWNMFDFASPWRTEGERDGINDKGLVTYDRKTRKDAFYLYQANWAKSPVLHLLARRDRQRKDANTVIRYYANVEGVEVTLNGQALPAAVGYGPRAFIIPNVQLRPGKNIIHASAKAANSTVVKDEVEWTLAAP